MAQVPVPTISYGVDRAVQVQAVDLEVGPKQTSYTLKTPWGTAALELRLTGRFNVYNSLLRRGLPWRRGGNRTR